jgi:hypothetical protein
MNMSSNLPARDFSSAAEISVAGRVYPFRGLSEASRCYREAIEILDLGYSCTPPCLILDAAGQQLGYVSYNGRVWACAGGFPADILLFDPTRPSTVSAR